MVIYLIVPQLYKIKEAREGHLPHTIRAIKESYLFFIQSYREKTWLKGQLKVSLSKALKRSILRVTFINFCHITSTLHITTLSNFISDQSNIIASIDVCLFHTPFITIWYINSHYKYYYIFKYN